MGTTAEKGAYLNTTKSLLKQKINNLGGDITDETTFREYTNQLQNIYDNLPKTDYAEGTEITLSNTLKGKLDFENDIVGYGQTEQESTNGYQLFNPTLQTSTKNGITCTRNDDNTFTLNGTATAQTLFSIQTMTLDTSKTYTLTGCPSGGSGSTYFIGGANFGDYGNGMTAMPNRADITFSLVVQNGVTVNNLIFKPMLEEGSIKHNFEKYTGGIPAPNPSYPQEIEVVRGKNLFDQNIFPNATSNTRTLTNNNGTITLNGTNTGASNFNVTIDYTPTENETISISQLSGAFSGGEVQLVFIDSNGTNPVTAKIGTPATLVSGTKYTTARISIRPNVTCTNLIVGCQLEKGSQATSYLPYNTLEIEERGKNLLNTSNITTPITSQGITITPKENGSFELKGIATANVNFILGNYDFKKGTAYTISDGLSDNAYGKYTILIPTYQAWGNNTIINGKSTTFEAKSSDNFNITMVIYNGTDISSGITIYPQLEQGSTATDYEPYQTPQTYQLSLGEYEFAKIGNYVDTIEYDVDEDKVYKNKAINKYQFTGNENFGKAGSTNLNGYIFNFPSVTTNILPPANNGTKANILSNAFITKAVDTIISEATYGIGIRSDKYLYIGAPLGSFENVSALQTYLANNITFMYYTLITPVKKEITGTLKDQIKALYNSQSFTGTTIIEIDGQLPLVLKVRALKGN